MQPLQIGVCSWSLKIPDLGETLATIKDQLGLNLVQIGFFDDSYKDSDKVLETVRASGPLRGDAEGIGDRRGRRRHRQVPR